MTHGARTNAYWRRYQMAYYRVAHEPHSQIVAWARAEDVSAENVAWTKVPW